MNGQFTIGDLRPSRYFIGIAIVLGLLFASIAPESGSNWLIQTVQWQVQTVVPMLICILVHIQLSLFRRLKSLNPWLKLFISGVIAAGAFSPIGLLSDVYLANEIIERSILMDCIDEFLAVALPITVCWIAINAPFQLGFQFTKSPISESNEVKSIEADFLTMIPEGKKGDLIYLKSELHYLLVVTSKGETLILYSLKNAISDLPKTSGMQIHRSYWANTTMASELEKTGREGKLLMNNGDTLPVSRRYLQALQEKLA